MQVWLNRGEKNLPLIFIPFCLFSTSGNAFGCSMAGKCGITYCHPFTEGDNVMWISKSVFSICYSVQENTGEIQRALQKHLTDTLPSPEDKTSI